jgi:hypothetical protein
MLPVFRVIGLLVSQPDDELNTALTALINDNLSEQERSKTRVSVAMVPSWYDDEQERLRW